jgi:succinoglycan biosynthesis protein ExoL
VHFNWCADLSDGKNSLWLLPNRLYEGGYFGVPALAIADHETGRIVLQRNLGFALRTPSAECLKSLLLGLSTEQYKRLREAIEAKPASHFVDGAELDRLLSSIPICAQSSSAVNGNKEGLSGRRQKDQS